MTAVRDIGGARLTPLYLLVVNDFPVVVNYSVELHSLMTAVALIAFHSANNDEFYQARFPPPCRFRLSAEDGIQLQPQNIARWSPM
jgi:hypothetical protein